MTRVSVVSVKMTVKKKNKKKTDTGDAGVFYLLFCTVYCNENRLKNNMTPYEPRHEKTCLGTDHLIFLVCVCGGGGGGGSFFSSSQNIFFRSKQKQNIYIYIF